MRFYCIMENGAFAFLEQMLRFSIIFSTVFKLYLNFLEFFQCCLKKENDVMIKNSLWSKGSSLMSN